MGSFTVIGHILGSCTLIKHTVHFALIEHTVHSYSFTLVEHTVHSYSFTLIEHTVHSHSFTLVEHSAFWAHLLYKSISKKFYR